jgi:hypothetical protein
MHARIVNTNTIATAPVSSLNGIHTDAYISVSLVEESRATAYFGVATSQSALKFHPALKSVNLFLKFTLQCSTAFEIQFWKKKTRGNGQLSNLIK